MFEQRAGKQVRKSAGAAAAAPRRTGKAAAVRGPGALRWALFLVLGVAVTATAGYLVAALVFFPAPLMPGERQVARVTGMSEDEARGELERQGMVAAVIGRESHPSLSAGWVVWQDPPPGVAIPRGTQVGLILSSGTARVVVPDVRGYDPDFARKLLQAAGLRVDGIDSVAVKGVPPGAAGSTDPAAGDSVVIGRSIFLHIAR